MSFLDFVANGTWDGYSATDDGSPGFVGTEQNIFMQGMDVNTTQYVGSKANAYTLVVPTDASNPAGSALFLDDPVHANQNGVTGQPFLVGIKNIVLTGNGPVLIDLTSTQFSYTPLTITGGDGTYTLLGNSGYDTFTVGNGAFDSLYVTEDHNNLKAGDGIQDAIWTGGPSNYDQLVLGNGEEDKIYVTSGSHDLLQAGNGDYNLLTVDGEGNSYDKLVTGNGWGNQLTINDGTHNTLVAGNGNLDVLTTGNGDFNSLSVGNGYGDTLTAGNGNHTLLIAGDGAGDVVSVGQGNSNWVVVGNGDGDVVTVAGGNLETVATGNGAGDIVTVGDGSGDFVNMGNGAGDVATIGNGSWNTIDGGTGNDAVLTIGNGSYNTIIVPDGASTISFGGGNGCGGCCSGGGFSITVTHGANPTGDILTIGAGSYNAIYSSDGADTTLVLGAGSHNYASTGDGAGDVVYVGDGNSNVVQGGAGFDTIYGGNGEGNTFYTGSGGSLIYTGTGNDTVVGGSGNDTIVVGLHTETTSTAADPSHLKTTDAEAQHITLGSAGTDAVIVQGGTTANMGTEVITAGSHGNDTFFFGGQFGDTVISGFNAAQDKLMLAGVTTGALGSATETFSYVHSAYSTDHNQNDKNDLLITVNGTSTITLLNFAGQDPSHQFANASLSASTTAGLATLSKIFDFSAADQTNLLTGIDLSHQAHHFGV